MARVVLFARMFTKSNVLCCGLYIYIYACIHAVSRSVAFRYDQEEPARQ